MKLESDVNKVFGALVMLHSVVLHIRVIRTQPLAKQIGDLQKWIEEPHEVHPSRRYLFEVAMAAFKGELARVKAQYESTQKAIDEAEEIKKRFRPECPQA